MKAVVIRINSPGAVTASDIMYQDLVSFRSQTHKPVVTCMMDARGQRRLLPGDGA